MYQTLARSPGWDQLVEDHEEALGGLMNTILEPCGSIEGLIKRESVIGEIRGVKRVFRSVETNIEILQMEMDQQAALIENLLEDKEDNVQT